MPEDADEYSVTRADAEREARRFMNSTLGKELQRRGVTLEERFVKTNFKRLTRITSQAWNPKDDYNLTLMGRELIEVNSSPAHAGRRVVEGEFDKYLDYCRAHFPTWHYWQDKEYNRTFESKAAVDPLPMAETLSWYAAPNALGEPSQEGVLKMKDYMIVVMNKMQEHMNKQPEVKITDTDAWRGRMNWNRNSGHPFWMPISEERYFNVDWPNFRDSLMAISTAMNREELEKLAAAPPATVPNANAIIYGMFMRPPDRVIHAAELYWKGPGAVVTSNFTPNLRGSRVAWDNIPTLAEEFSDALVDATVVIAEDFTKFDRSIPKPLLKALYEAFWESEFLKNMPELRNLVGALLWILTKDGQLQVSATHALTLLQGLPSGHPLTQWVGCVIHLGFYEWWAEELSFLPTLSKVLSDDGISVHKDMSLDEADAFLFGPAADTVHLCGMEFHPDKSKLCDPTERVYMGQCMGTEIYANDMTFFLKRNFQNQAFASYGNPAGVMDSLLQSERSVSDEFQETIDKYLISNDQIRLGGRIPKGLYDIARCVDIIASAGVANPLIDDYIHYVQSTWPGFQKRGVKYLTELLDESWRMGETTYAGGTLDSGILRQPVVEALLDLDGSTKFWDEKSF